MKKLFVIIPALIAAAVSIGAISSFPTRQDLAEFGTVDTNAGSDMGTLINTATAAIKAAGCGTLRLPETGAGAGLLITTPIVPRSCVTIQGKGRGQTVLLVNNTYGVAQSAGTQFYNGGITGVTFRANTGFASSSPLYFTSIQNSRITNIGFEGFRSGVLFTIAGAAVTAYDAPAGLFQTPNSIFNFFEDWVSDGSAVAIREAGAYGGGAAGSSPAGSSPSPSIVATRNFFGSMSFWNVTGTALHLYKAADSDTFQNITTYLTATNAIAVEFGDATYAGNNYVNSDRIQISVSAGAPSYGGSVPTNVYFFVARSWTFGHIIDLETDINQTITTIGGTSPATEFIGQGTGSFFGHTRSGKATTPDISGFYTLSKTDIGGPLSAASLALTNGTTVVTPTTCSSSQFVNGVNSSGVPTCATPTTGSSTAAAGSSGQFQTNSSGSLAGVTISGDVSINGTTGVATVNPLSAVTLTQPGNGTDLKLAKSFVNPTDGAFYSGFLNDAQTFFYEYMHVTRSGAVPNLAQFTVPLAATGLTLGAPQTAVGQLGQITSGYTTGMLNTSQDIFRVQVGTLPPSWEFGLNSSNPQTNAIVGALAIPAGSYSGVATFPDASVSGYAVSYSTGKSGLGLFGFGGVGADGAFVEGINTVTTNCETPTCVGSTPRNFAHLYGTEHDVNIYGATAPTGDVVGVLSFIQASVAPTGSLNAFEARKQGSVPWNVAYTVQTGAANVGLSLNPSATSGASTSQPIFMTGSDGTTARTASIQANSDGSLQLAPGGGTIVLGTVPTSGTATGTLCVASGNRIYIKTTAGACL